MTAPYTDELQARYGDDLDLGGQDCLLGCATDDRGCTTSFPVAWLFSMYRWAATMSSRLKTRSRLGR